MQMIGALARFNPGQIGVSSAAMSVLTQDDLVDGLIRHLAGDWGDVDEHDWKKNDEALERGLRLLSSYCSKGGTKFWIITEHDRSLTTIMLPSDY